MERQQKVRRVELRDPGRGLHKSGAVRGAAHATAVLLLCYYT